MSKLISKVTIRSPGTTANMGSGFDCIGMALEIFNIISVELSDCFNISITGEGANTLSLGPENMIYQAIQTVFEKTRQSIPTMRITCQNDIPINRGLGSSAAAVVGGLMAGNIMSGRRLSDKDLLHLANQLEGHLDNISPALLGGCQIVVKDGEDIISTPVPISCGMFAVILIPELEISTDKGRRLLPSKVNLTDAVFNIGRAALLAVTLATGQTEALRIATQDAIHQNARQSLYPTTPRIIQSALDAGAYGAFLSGSGSSVLALTGANHDQIAKAMMNTATNENIKSVTKILCPCSSGASVISTG